MYKVVIADDERIIREGLEAFVDWEQFDFEVVSTFEDGNSLIEYMRFHPVDVIITDIKMPNGTGIDVARHCYETKTTCQLVLISAYQEFELAKSAVKYDVRDYLLKPLDIDAIEELLKKIKLELDEEKNKDVLLGESEHDFLSNMLLGIWNNKDYMRDRMKFYFPDVNPDEGACALVNLTILDYERLLNEGWHHARQQFEDALNNFCGVVSSDAIFRVIRKKNNYVGLIVMMKGFATTGGVENAWCMEQMEQFRRSFEEIFRRGIEISIENVYESVFQLMECQKENVQRKGQLQRRNLWEKKKLIISHFLENNNRTAYRILKGIMDNELLREELLVKKEFVNDLFLRLIHLLEESDEKRVTELDNVINFRTLSGIRTEEELQSYCQRVFGKADLRKDSSADVREGVVEKVLDYIDQHVMEDILMEEVANQMYISTPYLAKCFKEKTGETFLQCVTRKKMEKAAEMIRDTDLRVYEIGELLGYRTPRYFSKLFYEFIKCYPNEYRKTLMKDGRENVEIH